MEINDYLNIILQFIFFWMGQKQWLVYKRLRSRSGLEKPFAMTAGSQVNIRLISNLATWEKGDDVVRPETLQWSLVKSITNDASQNIELIN